MSDAQPPPRSPPRLSQSPSTPKHWLLSPLPRRTHASAPARTFRDGDVAYESISNIPREEWPARRIHDDGGSESRPFRLKAVTLAVSCVVLLAPFAAGLAVALALHTMQEGEAPAARQWTWEVDLVPALGALAAGACADAFGRQRTLCAADLVLALSLVLTCFRSASELLAAVTAVFRAAAVGTVAVAATLYVVEALAGPKYRGRAACSALVAFLAGGTACTCALHTLSATPQAVAVIAAILACLSTVAAAAVLPDTPLWLASVGALRAAEDVLYGLRAPEDAGAEAADLSALFGIATASSTSPPRRSMSSAADGAVVVRVAEHQAQRPQRACLAVWLVIALASLLGCITCPAASAALLGSSGDDTHSSLVLIHFLSAALGAAAGAYAVDAWGRRTTLVVGCAAAALCGSALAATLLVSPTSGTRLAYATAAVACLVACTTGGPVCAALTLAHEAHQHKRGALCGAAWAVAMLLVSAGCATVRVTAGRSVEAAGLVAVALAMGAALTGLAFAAAAPHVLPPTAGLPWSQLHATLRGHGAVVTHDGGARRAEAAPRLGLGSSPLREPLLHSPASQHSALTAALRAAAATEASFNEDSPPASPHRGSQGGPGSSVESSTPSMRGLMDDVAQGGAGQVPKEGGRLSPKGPAAISGHLPVDDAATFPGFQTLILPSGDSPAASKPPRGGGARRSLR